MKPRTVPNGKIINRKLKSQKQEAYTGLCSRRELRGNRTQGDTRTHKDTEGQDITTTIRQTQRGHTETYIHTQGSNWPQVEHMRTGADNHKDRK